MEAAIIASLKRRYRAQQYNRALGLVDEDGYIYNIDQLTAMKYLKEIWEGIPSDTI